MLEIIGFIVLIGLGGYLLFSTWGMFMLSGFTGKVDWIPIIIFFGLACGCIYLAVTNAPFNIVWN